MSTSATFHLPEEILSIVLDHFQLPSAKEIGELRDPDFGKISEHDRQLKLHISTLASLCQVSRALNRITRPLLYSVFLGFRLVNARLFVRALAKNRELGEHVRGVVIDKWEHVAWNDDSGAHGIDRSHLSLEAQCEQYAKELCRRSCYPIGLGSPIGSELESGRADVVLTMLMMLCLNVRAIETSIPCLPEEAHRQALLRAQSLWFLLDNLVWHKWSNDSDRRYASVRDLSIRLERHSGAFGVLFCKTLLEMPGVESLSAWRLNLVKLLNPHPMDVHYQYRDPWPGLERIELRECRIENATIGALLLRAPNLRILDIQWAAQTHRLHFGIIGEFLNTRGEKLEVVRLDTRQNRCITFGGDTRPPIFHTGEAVDSSLGSLESMSHLKSLSVTTAALFGYHRVPQPPVPISALPAGIQDLTILQQTNESHVEGVERVQHFEIVSLIKHAQVQMSQLRQITISGTREDWKDYKFDPWSISSRDPYHELCPEQSSPSHWNVVLRRKQRL